MGVIANKAQQNNTQTPTGNGGLFSRIAEEQKPKVSGYRNMQAQKANIDYRATNPTPPAVQAGRDISQAFKSGISKGTEGYEQIQGAKGNLGQTLEGAGKLGSGILGALFSPLAPVTKPIGTGIEKVSDKIGDIKAVQDFSVSPAGETTSRIAENVANYADIAGAVAGIKATPLLATKARNVASKTDTLIDTGLESIRDKVSQKEFDKTLKDIMPAQTKQVRIDELRQSVPESVAGKGGVVRKGILGEVTPVANQKLVDVARTVQPYLKGITDPLNKIKSVNKGIVDTSKNTNSFLDANPTRANFEDMTVYMQRNKPSFTLSKDPSASEAYSRATDSALQTLANEMKTHTSPIVSGSEIRNARMKIDQEITRQLGETVFDSPQYKGIKAAEVDTRNMLNRMNEDLVRYPNQLTQLNRMNEFIDAAKARGIEVDMDNPTVRVQVEDKFGLQSTPESVKNATALSDAHKKMTHLYTARDNMIDNFQASVGKGTKWKEWVKNNPVKARALGIGATLIGGQWVLSKIGD